MTVCLCGVRVTWKSLKGKTRQCYRRVKGKCYYLHGSVVVHRHVSKYNKNGVQMRVEVGQASGGSLASYPCHIAYNMQVEPETRSKR